MPSLQVLNLNRLQSQLKLVGVSRSRFVDFVGRPTASAVELFSSACLPTQPSWLSNVQ